MFSFYKNTTSNNLIAVTALISIFYFICLILNLSPYLRGPIDHSLASQWPYYFVNTLGKVWIFLPIYIGYLFIFSYIFKKHKNVEKNELVILFFLVLLTFIFQIALVYFSRFGLGVLFRRLVDPGINGYFTTAIKINDIDSFLNSFPQIINARHLAQHSSGHTPGAVLLIKTYMGLLSSLPTNIFTSFVNNLTVGWAKNLWTELTFNQKIAAITLPLLLHLIAACTVVPFYFLTKRMIKDSQNSLKIATIYSIIPSLSFFALVFDPFYALLTLVLVLLIYIGMEDKNMYLFWAGCFAILALFFTAAMLTTLVGLFVFALISYVAKPNKNLFAALPYFITGMFVSLIGLRLVGFDLIQSIIAVIHNQASRNYLPWLIFNPYDFFVYMGLPLAIIFIYQTIYYLKRKFDYKNLTNRLLYTFWLVFIMLIVSGASRGEVGRIWLPFMFLPIILIGNFITNELRFNKHQLLILFSLIFIQVIIMEEFWVPIW